MTSNYDLWSELTDTRKLLNECIVALKDNGILYAKSEHEYKIALRKEIYRLHEDEKVAWTTTMSMAHGDTDNFNVSDKRYRRDLAKTKYDVCLEKINGLKLEIRILESQLNREWGQAKWNTHHV